MIRRIRKGVGDLIRTGGRGLKSLALPAIALSVMLFGNSCAKEQEVDTQGGVPILFSSAKVTASGTSASPNANRVDALSGATRPYAEIVINAVDDIANQSIAEWRNVVVYSSRYTATASWLSPLHINGSAGPVEEVSGEGYYGVSYSPQAYYSPGSTYKYDFRLLYPAPGSQTGVTIVPPTATTPPYADVLLAHRPDVMIATPTDVNPITRRYTPVPVKFRHKLALVTLLIQKSDDIDYNVYLQRVSIRGRVGGRLDLSSGQWLADSYESTPLDSPVNVVWLTPPYPDFIVPAASDGNAKHIWDMFLFPTTSAEAAQEENAYFFELMLNENNVTVRLPDPGNPPLVAAEAWQAGYHYTYTLNVTDTDIYIEVIRDELNDIYLEREIREDVDNEVEIN